MLPGDYMVKNSDSKIFVLRWIDTCSAVISNFLYISLICGSFYARDMNSQLIRVDGPAGI